MKPKKKSSFGAIVAISVLAVTVFIALHAAGAMNDTRLLYGEVTVGGFSEHLGLRIAEPLNIGWYEDSQMILLICVFVWFLTVAHISSSKKNYIAGKEYGTAKWGGLGDIRDLFAVNILKEEIKKAKKTSFPLMRFFVKRKVFKDARNNGKSMFADKLVILNEEKEVWAEQGICGSEIKKRYNERKMALRQEMLVFIDNAKKEGWLPLKLKASYDAEVEKINAFKDMHVGSSLFNLERHNKSLTEAKLRYNKGLKAFFNSSCKVAKLKKQYNNADALFTKSERASIYNFKINNNVLIMGGSGSGKSRGFVLPNLLQAHSSYVITDPKGEVLEKSGKFLKDIRGYDIRVLNLDNKTLSDSYNPFAYIYPERAGYEERVLELIEAIIVNTDGGEKRNSSDPFWDKAERLFLQAIFFFTCELSPEERTMNSVLKFIEKLKIEEERDKLDSDLDFFAEFFAYGRYRDSFLEKRGYKTESEKRAEAGEVTEDEPDDERVIGAGRKPEHIGYQQYMEFRSKASGKTAKSIVISAVARLAPFRTKEVRRIFSSDSMNLQELGEKKMAIFVVVPPTTSAYNFIAGILFTQMFQELQYCATEKNKHNGQRLPVPVRFILDEFANTCTIPNFVKILAYARSFGIGIVPILQSLEQIKNLYKDEWQVIIDNCATRLFLGSIASIDTLEYVSKMIGKGTFDKRTTGRTRGRQGSSSMNHDVVGRELLDAAELSKLPKEDCVLFISGRNPFYSKKYEYTEHPNYRYTSDANHSFAYDHVPLKPEPKSTHREEVLRSENSVPAVKSTPQIGFIHDQAVLLDIISSSTMVPLSNEDLGYTDDEVIDIAYEIFADEINEQIKKSNNNAETSALGIMSRFSSGLVAFEKDPVLLGQILLNGIANRSIEVLSNEDLSMDDGDISADDIHAFEEIEIVEDTDLEAELMQAVEEFDISLAEYIDALSPELRDTEVV